MLIATVDNYGTGYFTQYRTSDVHSALDNTSDYIDISTVDYISEKSFKVDNFYNKDGGSDVIVNSIQGYDLDNDGNIYISSQQSPTIDTQNGKFTSHHKQIVVIPNYAYNDSSQWRSVNLSAFAKLDIPGKHSELEGIQIISKNHCYLTSAYHISKKNPTTGKYYSYTDLNRIYELSWK